MVDERFAIFHCLALILTAAPKVSAGAHARADGAASEPVFVEGFADLHRVDVFRRLDGDFNGIETPFLKLGKEAGGFRRKRRSE